MLLVASLLELQGHAYPVPPGGGCSQRGLWSPRPRTEAVQPDVLGSLRTRLSLSEMQAPVEASANRALHPQVLAATADPGFILLQDHTGLIGFTYNAVGSIFRRRGRRRARQISPRLGDWL